MFTSEIQYGDSASSLYLVFPSLFLSATEYHSDADYNSRRVGVVVVVVVVVVHTFKNGLTFERLDQFASYLEGSCTRVSRFTSYAYATIQPTQLAQPAYNQGMAPPNH